MTTREIEGSSSWPQNVWDPPSRKWLETQTQAHYRKWHTWVSYG